MEILNKPTFNFKPVLSGVLSVFGAISIITLFTLFFPDCASKVVSIFMIAGIYALYKFCFRKTFKSHVDALNDSQVKKLIIAFLVADVLLASFDIARSGFSMPTMSLLVTAIGAGITEELLFRGLFTSLMMRKCKSSYLFALIVPAVAFGLIHLTNVFAGHDLTYTLFQSVAATIAGIFFGALYLRTGNVIPGIVLHGIHDILAFSAVSTGTVAFADILLVSVLSIAELVIVYFLLKGQKENILNLWKNKWSR